MDSVLLDTVVNHLFNGAGAQGGSKHRVQGEEREAGNVPVDLLETSKAYVFYLDVPGLSKSDIQVELEEGKVLVMKSNSTKRKREEEEEGCKYVRLERRGPMKFVRKFRLSDDANLDGISAKCENGVLTVSVPKVLPQEKKSRTVQVKVA